MSKRIVIKESFEWMAPEFQVVSDAGKNTIRIKGVAMKSDVISKNKRRYVDEELVKSARTWIGKPVTINHDMNRKVGNVIWMEYSDGALEYVADIKKNPYVTMLRDGSTALRGVSIEANYLHNRCPECGQKFWTEESFHSHMHNEHFIKTDVTKEPHGIVGQALSLVLSPEEPGYGDTSIQLMESYEKPVLRLLETVVTTNRMKEKAMTKIKKAIRDKAAITPNQRVTMHVAKTVLEQEDHECGEDEHWDETQQKCVKNEAVAEQDEHQCGEDEHWDEDQGKCVKNEVAEQEEAPTPPCGEGWHEVDGKCVKDIQEQAVEPEPPVAPELTGEEPPMEPKCPLGFHREGDVCVVDAEPEEEPVQSGPPAPAAPAETPPSPAPVPPDTTATASEIKLPTLLKLGEPFSGYTDFADCVNKNQDKEDPDAYCASIKQKVEGESVKESILPRDVYEAFAALAAFDKTLYKRSYQRDIKAAEAINKLNRAVAEISKNFTASRLEAKRRYQALGKIGKAVKELREFNIKKLGQLATAQAQDSRVAILNLANLSKAVNKSVAEMKQGIKGNATKILKAQENFDKTLAVADTNVKEIQKQYDTLKERVKEQEEKPQCAEDEHWDEEQKKCVKNAPPPEVEEIKKKLEETVTKLENLEDKLPGQFKGHAPALKEKQVKEYAEDPNKPLKKKGKK